MGAAACEAPDEAARREAPPAPTFTTQAECLGTGVFGERACDDLVVAEGEAPPPSQARDYTSVGDCQADDYFADDYCVAKYEEAVQLHQDYGPAYDNLSACEADYGAQRCGQQPVVQAGGGSFWSPFLTGYLVSSLINDVRRPIPYYRDPYGGYRTMGGTGFQGGNAYLSRDAYRQQTRVTTGVTNAEKARTGRLAKAPTRAQSRRTSVARRGGFGGRSGGRGG